MSTTLLNVFRHWHYTLLALGVTFIVFSLALFVPNLSILAFGVGLAGVSFTENVAFVLTFYGSIFTNFTLVGALLTTMIAALFGMNVATLTYYIRQMQGGVDAGAGVAGTASITGLIAGFLGIGCAACGSVILTAVLGLIGAGGLLVLLPFHGEEFAFIAVGLMVFALYNTMQKIAAGTVCLVE